MLSKNLAMNTRAERRRLACLDRLNSSRHDFSLASGAELAKRVDTFHRLVSRLNYPESFHTLIPRIQRFSRGGALVPRLLNMVIAVAFISASAQTSALAAEADKVEKQTEVKVETTVKEKPVTSKDSHLSKADRDTINAVNEIEGVKVDPEKFQEKKKKKGIGFPNPVGWLLKPVTDMQKRVVHLEQQIMRLEGPIAGLQKPMNGLRGKMVEVQGNMGTLNNGMSKLDNGMDKLDNGMGKLQGNMTSIEHKMTNVDSRLARMEKQLSRIYDPINGLQDPIVKLQKPVAGVSDQLSVLKHDLSELKQVVNVTSTLILIAIVSIGLMVVIGTPVVGVLAWKYRHKIIQKVEGPAAAEKEKEKEKELAGVR